MAYTIDNAPLTWRHCYITAVASLGQLIGTGLATLVSVIIPLYQIVSHPELSSFMQGLVGAMDLIGIMVGSTILGKLSDKYGYLLFFRLCPAIVCVASIIILLFPHLWVLIVCLFFMGFGIGGEYSLDSNYVSQLMPTKWNFMMVGATKAASALGNIGVAAACFLIVKDWSNAHLWSHLLWLMIILSSLMIILRIRWWESPKWLLNKGNLSQAEKDVHHFLGNDINVSQEDIKASDNIASDADELPHPQPQPGFLRRNWKNVIFTGVPWACEGLGVYGIGIFLPILVMALGLEHISPGATSIMHVDSSVKITLWISCIILPGFILGLFLINHVKPEKIQWWGFFLSAISLLVLLLAYEHHWAVWISIVSFMAFEMFLNMGPHLITFVLPPKVYPVADRGLGSGIAASLGKIGAVLGVFFIPILLHSGGSSLVLIVSIIVMIVGGVVTFIFNPERGENVANNH
ncbi:MAG: MFS transporter [Muribaculaceae bacterium]|nr:MFS transporter [Muribaculaceae bacterium]